MYLVTECACHIEIKGYLLAYLLTYFRPFTFRRREGCVLRSASPYDVCLYVCGSVCPLMYGLSKKPSVQTSRNCLHMLLVIVARSSSDDDAISCISGFVNDVMFSHNRPNAYTVCEVANYSQ